MPCSITVYIPLSVKSFISALIGESTQSRNEWALTFFNIPPPNVPISFPSWSNSLHLLLMLFIFLGSHWPDIVLSAHSSDARFKKMNELDGTGASHEVP